jgi:hypothetical protein
MFLAHLSLFRDTLRELNLCSDAERDALLTNNDAAFAASFSKKERLIADAADSRRQMEKAFQELSLETGATNGSPSLSDVLRNAPAALREAGLRAASETIALRDSLRAKHAQIQPLINNRLAYFSFIGSLVNRLANQEPEEVTYLANRRTVKPVLVDQAV